MTKPIRNFSIYDNDGNFIDHTAEPVAIFNAVTGLLYSVVDIANAKEMLAYAHSNDENNVKNIIAMKLFDENGVDDQDVIHHLIERHRDGRPQYLFTVTNSNGNPVDYVTEPGAVYNINTGDVFAFCENANSVSTLFHYRLIMQDKRRIHPHASVNDIPTSTDIVYVQLPKDQHTLNAICKNQKITLPAAKPNTSAPKTDGPLVLRDKQNNILDRIKKPAVVFKRDTGTVLHIGEAALIQIQFAINQGNLEVSGDVDKANHLVYFELPHDQAELDKIHLVPGYAPVLYNKLMTEHGKKE